MRLHELGRGLGVVSRTAARAATGLAYFVFFILAAHVVIFRKPLIIVASTAVVLFITLKVLSEPPSDDEMIAHFATHRATFEALVAKLYEDDGRCTVDGDYCKNHPVPALMKEAGVTRVNYEDRTSHIEFTALQVWTGPARKVFVYYPVPITSAVFDLHREDADMVVPALLCRSYRKELQHLCDLRPRVNDLDVLLRYSTGKFFEAERPIDEHWVVYVLVIR